MRTNRWTVPLVTAALLAAPAVLLGWNGAALASAAARPWTTAAGEAPSELLPARRPASAPVPAQTPAAVPEPTSAPARTVVIVHNTRPQTVEETVTETASAPAPEPGDNDVRELPDQRGTDSGAPPNSGPVEPTDPANPDVTPAEEPTDPADPGVPAPPKGEDPGRPGTPPDIGSH